MHKTLLEGENIICTPVW